MRASAAETEITENNVSIGVLGRGQDFRTLTKEKVRAVLSATGGDEQMQIDLKYFNIKTFDRVIIKFCHLDEPSFNIKPIVPTRLPPPLQLPLAPIILFKLLRILIFGLFSCQSTFYIIEQNYQMIKSHVRPIIKISAQ